MHRPLAAPLLLLLILLLAGCASTSVPMSEPRRLVGTENGVRLDAFVRAEIITENTQFPLTWEITNERPDPIAVADMIPDAAYDPETRTITVSLGSEVPGENLLPRLIVIAPGQKQSFTGAVRIHARRPHLVDPTKAPPPHGLYVKLNFLGDVQPFVALTKLTAKAVSDPQLADQLFPLWLERNETVLTNSVPLRWRDTPAEVAPGRRP